MNREVNGPDFAALPPNVIVKWQEWRAWRERDVSNVAWVEFEIRFAIIPDQILEAYDGKTPSAEPERSFFTYTALSDDGQHEEASFMYPCVTYALRVPADLGPALRRAVELGTVPLVHKREGTPAIVRDAAALQRPDQPFLGQVMRMIAYTTKQYPKVLEEQRAYRAAHMDEVLHNADTHPRFTHGT